jgi:hypothetical protein
MVPYVGCRGGVEEGWRGGGGEALLLADDESFRARTLFHSVSVEETRSVATGLCAELQYLLITLGFTVATEHTATQILSKLQKVKCLMSVRKYEYKSYNESMPPLWSSGQSSWLQIRRPGFDSRHYQKKK